jgi:hypothetical protein
MAEWRFLGIVSRARSEANRPIGLIDGARAGARCHRVEEIS